MGKISVPEIRKTEASAYQTLKDDRRISTHPCYSKDGHKYARMHLPVAPACNIQCNYCNRKFDCSNESRPGVVSKLLTPDQAAYRVQAVKARMPELKVVGIAGPGDPLANPKQTIAALKAIKKLDDDLHLCVSTNGLALPAMVDQLAELNVNHITITLNTLNPDIAADLYPWIYFDNQRIHGREAGEILISQQLEGLSLAAKAGMLVKINTVLVPGINDRGLDELAKEIRNRGALLHNIMPLISDPSHGTFFGLNHLTGPTTDELNSARQVAGIELDQMTHCQQCRADAIGKLGDGDCSSMDSNCGDAPASQQLPPATKTQRIAIASKNGQLVDNHFGYADHFLIFDVSDTAITAVDTRYIETYCHGPTDCNDDSASDSDHRLSKHLQCLQDCDQVLCSRIGIQPWRELEQQGTLPNTAFALFEVETALHQIQQNLIKEIPATPAAALKEVG